MKITKKFYVASQSMHPTHARHSEWAHETLEEAIEHASELARDTEKDQIIVQIIKVVRPLKAPIEVVEVE